MIYVVKAGDTLSSVAREYGTSVPRLISDNGIARPYDITPGQALLVLIPNRIYTVRGGDTLYSVAEQFGTTPQTLLRYNPEIAEAGYLREGSTIAIGFTEEPGYTRLIGGYAYPFISPPLLRRTLPFLSQVTVFGYGFTAEGELIEPNDTAVLSQIRNSEAVPILLLSSVTEDGNFDGDRAAVLFESESLQDEVLGRLVSIMNEKGYRGLDIDFEYVAPEDARGFIDFISRAVDVMHENGYTVNVDLAPKTSADQRGLLYEAHDYPAIGALADTVLLMTYEWGYTYGPPMAVAPIDQVRRVVEYAVSEIPREKITMGMPNYGYDWTLPFQKGITRAQSVSNEYAVRLATQARTDIEYDERAQSPYFYRTEGTDEHVVWFEDVRSVKAKIDLALEYGLRGVAFWNLMRAFSQAWGYFGVTLIPERL